MLPKLLTSIFGSRNERLLKQYRRVVEKVNTLEPQFEALDDDALRAKTEEFRQRMNRMESTSEQLDAVDKFFQSQLAFGERLQYRPAQPDVEAIAA